jgi:hypothetical protein
MPGKMRGAVGLAVSSVKVTVLFPNVKEKVPIAIYR